MDHMPILKTCVLRDHLVYARCYIVKPSLIGWVHTQNDPCVPRGTASLKWYKHKISQYLTFVTPNLFEET